MSLYKKILLYLNVLSSKSLIPKREQLDDELSMINKIIDFVYSENKSLMHAFEKSVPILQEKFFSDLLDGSLPESTIKETVEAARLKFPFGSFLVAIFETVDFHLDDEISFGNQSISDFLGQRAQEFDGVLMSIYFVRKGNDKLVVIFNLDLDGSVPERVYEYIMSANDHIKDTYSRKFTVGLSGGSKLNDLEKSYLDALIALGYKVVKGQGNIIFVDEVNQSTEQSFLYSMDLENKIINLVKTGNFDELNPLLINLIDQNVNTGASPEIVKNLFQVLAGTAIRTIYDIQATPEEVLGSRSNLHRTLVENEMLEDKRCSMVAVFQKISSYIDDRKIGQYERLMLDIKDYVAKHYNKDISLSNLGSALGMSSTYLSGKCKEITGMSFVDLVQTIAFNMRKRIC